ncbi:hypothetical protein MG293_001669 [Ovis ammon polii]|uniref:Uncharacterized protein n=1 Tax=Ovis ammon polii TaxID=230172 RepID=A0AAD4YI98_OVIAM|nr:hypothetical protein MG293_001669 [Ovis ammon polii]
MASSSVPIVCFGNARGNERDLFTRHWKYVGIEGERSFQKCEAKPVYESSASLQVRFSSFYNTINVSVKKENLILSRKETLQLVWFLLLVYGPYLKRGHTAEKRGAVGYPALQARALINTVVLEIPAFVSSFPYELYLGNSVPRRNFLITPFSACVLGPAHGARDALSSFGNFTIGVRFLGDSVNNWCSSVSFRFGMGDSTGDLNKAKTHCCVSFHCGTCSFTVDGHESPEWSWIWTEKKFLYKAL